MWFWLMVFYVLGAALSIRTLAGRWVDRIIEVKERDRAADMRLYPSTWQLYHSEGEIVATDAIRTRATWLGLGSSLGWPLTMSVLLISKTVTSPGERARAAEAETKRLRELARAAGLEWPGAGE